MASASASSSPRTGPGTAGLAHAGPAGARFAGRGVVGFGLSNDERRGAGGRLRARVRHRPPGGAAPDPHGAIRRRRSVRELPGGPGRRPARARRARCRRRRGAGRGGRAADRSRAVSGEHVSLGVYPNGAASRLPPLLDAGAVRRTRRRRPCCSGTGWSRSTRSRHDDDSPMPTWPGWRRGSFARPPRRRAALPRGGHRSWPAACLRRVTAASALSRAGPPLWAGRIAFARSTPRPTPSAMRGAHGRGVRAPGAARHDR